MCILPHTQKNPSNSDMTSNFIFAPTPTISSLIGPSYTSGVKKETTIVGPEAQQWKVEM